jgi:nucleotide-binding universal stress UspA family protein
MYSVQAHTRDFGDAAARTVAPGGSDSLEQWLLNLEACGVRWRMMSNELGEKDRRWEQAANLDLLVCVEPHRSWWRRMLSSVSTRRLVERIGTSLFLVRQPRWPIRHILLIVRAESTDWAAFDWAMRVARMHRAAVSILPVVPPWPSLHRFSRHTQPEPNILLAPNTVSGATLNRMMRRFHREHIRSDLLLCSGEPDCRLRSVVSYRDPDLVVVAAESHSILLRWLCGELVGPLLRWIDRPVLIAR